MKSKRLEKLKFVFGVGSINGLQVLAIIVGALNKFGLPAVFMAHGVEIGIKALEKNITKKKSWPSGVISNGFEIRFGLLPALAQSFLTIEEVSSSNVVGLKEFVECFTGVDGFVQAWICDVEYDFWQNAKDPLEYECAGRSFLHLPKITNGLPAPLNQMEIDTSGNFGRNELRQGYVEAIGSTMWLSDLFWERVGKDKSANLLLLGGLGFKITEEGRNVKVVASEECFYDDSTIDKQRGLREVLFY